MYKLSFIFALFFFTCLNANSNADNIRYQIHKGDLISIYVMENPEFTFKELIVLPDGFIQYPGVGSIKVEGLSLDSLKIMIDAAVSQYIPNSLITVHVNKLYNHNINILGFVNKPGSYQVFEPVDVLFALALAGGVTAHNNCKISIMHIDGTTTKTTLKKIINSQDKHIGNTLVYPYDTIVVDQPNKINWPIITASLSTITLLTNLFFIFK